MESLNELDKMKRLINSLELPEEDFIITNVTTPLQISDENNFIEKGFPCQDESIELITPIPQNQEHPIFIHTSCGGKRITYEHGVIN